jgi:hypothetical protein
MYLVVSALATRPDYRQKAGNVNIPKFKAEFDKLSNELFGDDDRHKFYGRQEWKERGEPYGNDAILTIVIEESGWYTVLNAGDIPGCDAAVKRLEELSTRNKVYHELGYAWSMHFYAE